MKEAVDSCLHPWDKIGEAMKKSRHDLSESCKRRFNKK